VWAFYPEFKVIRNSGKSSQDANSLQVILFGLNVAFFAAYGLAWVPVLQVHSHRVAAFLAGVAMVIAGSLLRRHCFRMLGRSFTGDVQVRPDQQVVTRGAYSILRHPSYTAAVIMNSGTGLALGSWLSLIILFVASIGLYSYRITVEEQALSAAIGDPYREFMRTRKRLIPFIY
jgi:protein-S-isoprenylcysteine O-methyltransferase Ste14